MGNSTILIIGNKIFLEVIKEIKLFSKYKIKYYDNLDLYLEDSSKQNQLTVFFIDNLNKQIYDKIKNNNCPQIFVLGSTSIKNHLTHELSDQINTPFKILDLEKKIIYLLAKNEFKKNSIIQLKNYIINKNERKIKRGDLELQLSEKEVNFLILFTEKEGPINKNTVLKNVWNYSEESETHTVETHIHRLRKKIMEKFGDKNFIKNDNKGYYI